MTDVIITADVGSEHFIANEIKRLGGDVLYYINTRSFMGILIICSVSDDIVRMMREQRFDMKGITGIYISIGYAK